MLQHSHLYLLSAGSELQIMTLMHGDTDVVSGNLDQLAHQELQPRLSS